ncbi:MAG TPA: ATPase, partial [Leeuwenhoekiella sp.]|nr:ATPase [Leeuwenhoekiella sp.]
IEEINRKSALAPKYNDTVDRESAYELLNAKIKKAESEEAKEKAKEERATVSKSSRTSSRSNTTEKAIIKVLTSATVIRGVLGILGKLIK